MSVVLTKGRVLLVEGAASVLVRVGRLSILGMELASNRRVVVRRGKRIPFEALQDSILEISEGEGATKTELSESTVPESWTRTAREISTRRLSPVVVLGAADRGKNTFCLFLSNMMLKEGGSVALIDGDVGQGDIGPPAGVSMAFVSQPLFDLFSLVPETAVFIGSTTPSGVQDRTLEALALIRREVEMKEPRLMIFNTDGWVLDDAAVEYKNRVLSVTAPGAVIAIQLEGELEPILSIAEASGCQVFRVETSAVAHSRDRGTRKSLREQCYRKFLRGAALRSFLMERVALEYTFLSLIVAEDSLREELIRLLQRPVIAYRDRSGGLRVLVKGSGQFDHEPILRAAKSDESRLRIVAEDDVKGLLLALMDGHGRFLGLGMLKGIDVERRALHVMTPCASVPAVIRFGRIRLDEEFREIGFSQAFEP